MTGFRTERPHPAALLPRWPSALALILLSRAACADDVRDFNTDTPGKSFTPHTVAQGYVQVESDIVHVVEVEGTRLIEAFDPVLKYGLTDNVEIEVQTNGLLNLTYRADGRDVHLTGFGDTIPAIKWGVVGNDSKIVSVALRASIKAPTASAGLGNGAVEYELAAPAQLALPLDLSLQVQEAVDVLKNQNDTGKHFEYSETASIGKGFGNTNVSAELFAQSGTDPNSKALYTADLGISYSITPTVLLALGTYFGLNRYAPGIEAYSAIGFRF